MTVEKWELAPKALVNLWKTVSRQHIRISIYCLTISQMFKQQKQCDEEWWHPWYTKGEIFSHISCLSASLSFQFTDTKQHMKSQRKYRNVNPYNTDLENVSWANWQIKNWAAKGTFLFLPKISSIPPQFAAVFMQEVDTPADYRRTLATSI
jgi:hypothetical protein